MFETVDSGSVTIRKFYLDRVVPHCCGALRSHTRLEHGQHGTRSNASTGGYTRLFFPFVIAQRARTLITQIRKIEVAGVPIRPRNVNAFAGRNAHFHVHRFLSHIVRYRHCFNSNRIAPFPLRPCQLEPVKAFAIIPKSGMVGIGATSPPGRKKAKWIRYKNARGCALRSARYG